MPAAVEYVPLNIKTDSSKQLQNAYKTELLDRRLKIAEAEKYYKGEMKKPIKSDGTNVDDNLVLPLCTTLIDKGVANMVGTDDHGVIEGVRFEVVSQQEENPADTTQAELDNLWAANRKNKFLHNLFLSASITGHYFVQVRPDEAYLPNGNKYPRLVNLNPANTSVFWQEDDAEKVLWYRIDIGTSPKRRIQDFVREMDEFGDETGRWLVYTYAERSEDEWKLKDDKPIAWEYSWSPICDGQNLPNPASMGYYGRNDLGSLGSLNDYINWLVSNQGRIVKNQAFPVDVVKNFELPEGFKMSPDTIIQIPNADGDFRRIQDATDLTSIQSLVQFLQRMFYNAGREIDPATVADKLGDLTNFGLRIMHEDSLFKRQMKWLDAAYVLSRVSSHGLELLNLGANIGVNVIPPDPLPHDPTEQANALKTDVEVFGVSQQTAQERRGYAPDVEDQRNEKTRRQRVADSRTIANAKTTDALQLMGRQMRNQPNDGQSPEQTAA